MLAAARTSGLLPARQPVVVMLSGGRDSTCLLDAAATLAGRGAVTALHVNHGLRREAGDDEEHCVELCERLAVPLVVERLGPAPATGNFHAWAREARYAAASSLTGAIATGHTATDQVETILYRLAASPGRRALLGMAAREGRVVRPLLEATREQTAAYCEARGLPWREDPANDDPTYRRARARNELVPALRRLHPAAEANVVRTAGLLREEAEVLDALVDEILGGHEEIELARLRSLPRALARLVVRRLAEVVLEARAPRVARRADAVLTLADDAALDLGDGARARVHRGVLTFERTPERSERRRRGKGEPAHLA
ncbi:MAG: tRNA lysidine(34) synthetase TilS [Solirubrobacteraceae bacterium]